MIDEYHCCSTLIRPLIATPCTLISTNSCLHLLLQSLLNEENKNHLPHADKHSFISCLVVQELKYYNCILVRTMI